MYSRQAQEAGHRVVSVKEDDTGEFWLGLNMVLLYKLGQEKVEK